MAQPTAPTHPVTTTPAVVYYHSQQQPQQPPNMYSTVDMPAGEVWTGFDDKDVRRGFIQKVYGILSVQLLFTFGFSALFFINQSLKHFIQTNLWLYIIAAIATFILVIIISCYEGPRRTVPWNYILLGLFTLAEAFTVAFVCAFHDVVSVLLAVAITTVCCVLVTAFSCWTKFDFTKYGWALLIASLGLSMVGLVLMIMMFAGVYVKALHIVFAAVGAVLFILWLAYDTQLVIGGKHDEIGPEDYILGALLLYIDIVTIFIYILQLIGLLRE